jgi:hypothetical protein
MRVKYNSPSPNHRRVVPNSNPDRVEEDPEDWVWEASNNFIVEIPDAQARKLMDENLGQFVEAEEEPEPEAGRLQQNPMTTGRLRGPEGTQDTSSSAEEWVEKVDSPEGYDSSPEPSGRRASASPRSRNPSA